MAWIESHEEVADHHKTHMLAEKLNCNVATAVGHLHLLWHFTLKVAWKDGNLTKHSPKSIARGCWFDGESDKLLLAFQEAGFMDGMKIHDWQKYAKHIIYQRNYNETRRNDLTAVKRLYKQKKYSRIVPATQPNLTLPNLTKETPPPTVRDQNSRDLAIYFHEGLKKVLNDPNAVLQWQVVGSHFKTLLNQQNQSVDVIKTTVNNYFLSTDPFIVNSGFVFNIYLTRFNQLKGGPIHGINSNTASRGYIGTPSPPGKYSKISENG